MWGHTGPRSLKSFSFHTVLSCLFIIQCGEESSLRTSLSSIMPSYKSLIALAAILHTARSSYKGSLRGVHQERSSQWLGRALGCDRRFDHLYLVMVGDDERR